MKSKKDGVTYFLAAYMNLQLIFNIIYVALFLCGVNEGASRFINWSINIFFLCGALLILIRRQQLIGSIALTIVGYAIFSMVSLLITPKIEIIFIKSIFYTLFNVIIIIILFLQMKNIESLEEALKPYIYISLLSAALQGIFFVKTEQYSMQYSYGIIISTLLALIYTVRRKSIKYGIIFLILFFTNVLWGSRGSILSYMIALIFIVFLSKKTHVKRIAIMSFFSIGTIFLYNIQRIFTMLVKIFPDSRTVTLFASGDFFYMSGREKYYSFVVDTVRECPFQIRGFYSDRIYLGEFFNRTSPDDIFGSYAHNFFMEILFQFGVWGIPILITCILTFIFIFEKIRKINDARIKNMFIIISSYCIGQLMFSSSYLNEPSFGAFVGLILTIKKILKKVKDLDSYDNQ